MRSVRIKEVFNFVHGQEKLFDGQSNNDIRTWIHRCLENNNLYFTFRAGHITGVMEWYRYPNIEELVWDFTANKLNSYNGKILYVNRYIYRPNIFCRKVLRRFLEYQEKEKGEEVQKIFISKLKNGLFKIKELGGM